MNNLQNRFWEAKFCALLLAMILVCNGGCWFSGAKKVWEEVKGGEGKLVVLKEPVASALLEYQNIRIEIFANNFAPRVPAYAPELVYSQIVKEMLEKPQIYRVNPTSEEGPTLIVRGSIIHYQSSEGISSVFSNYSQLICRVQLVDKASGQVIGEANCVGYSKAIARKGLEELGKGVASDIKRWLTTEPDKEHRD
jgi:hypothetical protein